MMNKMILLGAALASSLTACNQGNAGSTKSDNASTQRSSAVGNSGATSNSASSQADAGKEPGANTESGTSQGPTARATGPDTTNQNFNLNNRSQDTITHVYVSRVSDEQWGQDVLGASQVVAPGGSAQITFPRGESECNWDVRVTINNQQNNELRNLNLCETAEVNYD